MGDSFRDKVCLIVGGSRGIGFEIAKYFYSQGSRVVICSRNRKNANKAIHSFSSNLERINYFKVDVLKNNQVTHLIHQVIKKYKRIDILICSAGIFEPIGPFIASPFELHQKTIQTNLLGTMNCCHKAIPYMIRQGFGRIILFSGGGIGGDVPLKNASSYFVSKGALAFFAEVLSSEVKGYNITVNAILPGRILSDLTRATLDLPEEQLGEALLAASKDFKKTGGQTTEAVIKLIGFLCTDPAIKISGRLLSARWDKLNSKSLNIPAWKYSLKRIDGKIYKKYKLINPKTADN